MSSNLPPIDPKEDIGRYDAHEIKTKVIFPECNHRDARVNDTRTALVCTCGVAWTGSRLGELREALTKIKSII